MSEYDNTNTIAFWQKRPDAHEQAPDWKIEFNILGKHIGELAIWKRRPTDNPNAPYAKGKFSFGESDKSQYQQPQDESIPF